MVVGEGRPKDSRAVQAPPGAPIVHETWLRACKIQRQWLDPAPYLKQAAGADPSWLGASD